MKKHAAAYMTVLALISCAIIPSVASAAWWNPFSWGRTNPVTAPGPVSPVSVPINVSEASTSTPVVITKTVTVSDPAQTAKIAMLTAQVSDLNSQIATLTAENASLTGQVSSLASQIGTLKASAPAPVLDLSLEKSNLMIQYEESHKKPVCNSNAGLIDSGFGGSIPGQPGLNAGSECIAALGAYTVSENAWVNAQLGSSINE